MTGARVEGAVIGKNPEEDDRARHRHAAAEHRRRRPRPSDRAPEEGADRRRDSACHKGSGNDDRSHLEELAEVEMEADAEEEENNSELGHAAGQGGIGLEAGRVRPDDDASDQIADDWRESEPMRDRAEYERGGEAAGERENEIDVVHRGSPGQAGIRSANRTVPRPPGNPAGSARRDAVIALVVPVPKQMTSVERQSSMGP